MLIDFSVFIFIRFLTDGEQDQWASSAKMHATGSYALKCCLGCHYQILTLFMLFSFNVFIDSFIIIPRNLTFWKTCTEDYLVCLFPLSSCWAIKALFSASWTVCLKWSSKSVSGYIIFSASTISARSSSKSGGIRHYKRIHSSDKEKNKLSTTYDL